MFGAESLPVEPAAGSLVSSGLGSLAGSALAGGGGYDFVRVAPVVCLSPGKIRSTALQEIRLKAKSRHEILLIVIVIPLHGS
jgi:hypothetical protein